jgi:hypothetical protein
MRTRETVLMVVLTLILLMQVGTIETQRGLKADIANRHDVSNCARG